MNDGFVIDPMPIDIEGSPVTRVCTGMQTLFASDPRFDDVLRMAVVLEGPVDLSLSMLRSNAPGHGFAGKAMDLLTTLCDIHGVTVRLQSASLRRDDETRRGILDQKGLDAFYGRRGFVPDDANWRAYAMIRRPVGETSMAEGSEDMPSSMRPLTVEELQWVARDTADLDERLDALFASRTSRSGLADRRRRGRVEA